MGNLRNVISTNSGMRFMVENLELCSPAGRRLLLSQEMVINAQALETEFVRLEVVFNIIKQEMFTPAVESIRNYIHQLRDIHGTISNVGKAVVLDDIGLFEIKHFCLLSESIREKLIFCNCFIYELPDLQEVITLLDPDNQKLPQFYIYSHYSIELAQLRLQQQELRLANPEQAETLRQKCIEIEDEIRQQLSLQLFNYFSKLEQAHENLAKLDISFAKALQAIKMGLVRPEVASTTTSYTHIFNPWVKDILALKQKEFQPVDITLDSEPCLITGANMGGKTVLLKTIALAQYLFQFGFYIPASQASIVPVDAVFFSLEDEQSELSGLSSFAAEMLNINEIFRSVHSGKKILALIDEPARTTNPEEGRALVNAIVTMLAKSGIRSLVTSHYSNLNVTCRKLRVKGLQFSSAGVKLTFQDINNYMDYSLLEQDTDDVPLDALRIATMLGVDKELIEQATLFLKQNK